MPAAHNRRFFPDSAKLEFDLESKFDQSLNRKNFQQLGLSQPRQAPGASEIIELWRHYRFQN